MNKLITLIIALSLCSTWFYLIQSIALNNSYNRMTPYAYLEDSKFGDFDKQDNNWKGRVISEWLAGKLINAISGPAGITVNQVRDAIAIYGAIGLMCTFLLITAFVRRPEFVFLAIFAGMVWSVTPMWGPVCCSMPWDMPAMFWFTLSFLLWRSGYLTWFMLVACIGTAFKESVCMTAFLMLFPRLKQYDFPFRCKLFGLMVLAMIAIKLVIAHSVLGQAYINSFENFHHGGLYAPLENAERLRHVEHWFVFVNGGLAWFILLMKPTNSTDWAIKTVVACFWLGQFLVGAMPDDGREYLELIPMCAIYLHDKWQWQWLGKIESYGTQIAARI